MSKIARTAIGAGIDFTKEHWKDIGVVFAKLIPVYLVVGAVNMGLPFLMGPPTTMMDSFVIYGAMLLAYLGEMLFVLPLSIAAFRTALLKEPFDRSIYSRIFHKRELNFFKWYLIIMVIAVAPVLALMIGMGVSFVDLENPTTISPMLVVALGIAVIITFYLMFRLWYIMPAVATDRPMSLSVMWEMSKNKAWPLFKTMMLFMLVVFLFMAVLGIIFGAIAGMSHLTMSVLNPVAIGIMGIVGLVLYIAMMITFVGVSLGAMAHIYKTLEKK